MDELAEQCRKILNTDTPIDWMNYNRLGGTSGGARPKYDYSEWRGMDY